MAIFKQLVLSLPALILALVCPAWVHAQQGNSVEAVIKSIGLSKPAITHAPEFILRDAGGGTSALVNYRGDLVLLNFWATWCEPCREEMPSIERLHRNFGSRGLTILAVNQRENAAQVTKFLRANGLSFAAPLDGDGRVAESFRIYGIPSTFLIDANGQAIGLKSGPKDWATPEVIDAVRKLIGDSPRGSTPVRVNPGPAVPLPKMLRAHAQETSAHARHETQAEAIARLAPNEEMSPPGKASLPGEFWYMIKTGGGVIGRVRGSDVESSSRAK
ncbi:MAG TPA: TlpA disulfide reductase family protein [Candidatus Saccharimonadales bacterium]|nr:TlpA disulfide reductase family protein [Candidatus Saccharimonadales bacterium]